MVKEKSNFMEALYALSIGKSFRTSNQRNLFNKEKNLNEIYIFGMAHQNNNVFDLSINLKKVEDTNKIVPLLKAQILLESQYVFEAKDLDIIIGNPSYRRRFLDIHISARYFLSKIIAKI